MDGEEGAFFVYGRHDTFFSYLRMYVPSIWLLGFLLVLMANDVLHSLCCAVESVLFVARCSEDGDECGSPRC